jgi:hypothetical protein
MHKRTVYKKIKIYIKIYIKIDIITAPTCFGAATPSVRSAILVLAKGTVVNIEDGVTAPKHVGAVLMSILM